MHRSACLFDFASSRVISLTPEVPQYIKQGALRNIQHHNVCSNARSTPAPRCIIRSRYKCRERTAALQFTRFKDIFLVCASSSPAAARLSSGSALIEHPPILTQRPISQQSTILGVPNLQQYSALRIRPILGAPNISI